MRLVALSQHWKDVWKGVMERCQERCQVLQYSMRFHRAIYLTARWSADTLGFMQKR